MRINPWIFVARLLSGQPAGKYRHMAELLVEKAGAL